MLRPYSYKKQNKTYSNMFFGTYTCAFLSIFVEIFRKYQKVFTLKMTDYSQKREVCFNIQRNLFNIFNNLNRPIMKKNIFRKLIGDL